MTLGHPNDVNHLILVEDGGHRDLLLDEIISPLGAALGESLLLGLRPVLVEPPLGFFTDVFSPNSLESSQTAWGLNVTNNSNAHDWRSLEDCDGLHNLLLVDLGARSVHLPDDVCHASLVTL